MDELVNGLGALHRRVRSWRKITTSVFGGELNPGYVYQIAKGQRPPSPRAVELWAEYRRKHGSNGDLSLPEQLLAIIPVGIGNARTQSDLAGELLVDGRQIREAGRALRREGHDWATGTAGCWLAENEAERQRHVIGQIYSRAKDELQTLRLYLENRQKRTGLTIQEGEALLQVKQLELSMSRLESGVPEEGQS